MKNPASGFSIQTSDDLRPSQPTKRVAVVNNLWLGLTTTFFGMTGGPAGTLEDFLVDHNTAIPGGYSTYYVEAGTPPAIIRFRLTNNLMGFGAFGVPNADETFAKWLPGGIVAKNALVSLADTGDRLGATRNGGYPPAMYTSFPNAVAAGLNVDGTLTAKSPNRRAGTDSKDIGVDFDELQRVMKGLSPPR